MARKKILTWIPSVYHQFLPETFHREIPDESLCVCSSCAMTASEMDDFNHVLSRPFSPKTKCCTFSPHLPNYLVGAILSDEDPAMEEGRRRVIKRINEQEGVIPNGVYPSKEYFEQFNTRRKQDFGRSYDLLCPYFTSGNFNCSIWKYRESICALWFCKHVAGKTGAELWKKTMDYLGYLQQSFLVESAGKLGLKTVDIYQASVRLNPRDYWGKWKGREIEFYKNCYNYISNYPAREIKNLQQKGLHLENQLSIAIDKVLQVPDRLVANMDLLVHTGNSTYAIEFIHNISNLERSVVWTFELPCYILDGFNGKTSTENVLRQIEQNHQAKIDYDIILSLFHHGFLIDSLENN